MNKKQRAMKERIQKCIRGVPYGLQYIPNNWHTTLWNKSYNNITDFILDRFKITEDEMEYYTCLVYLITPNNKYDHLLIEWKDSENRKKLLKTYNGEVTPNYTIIKEKEGIPDKDKGIPDKGIPDKIKKITIGNTTLKTTDIKQFKIKQWV